MRSALLIGINRYRPEGGIPALKYAEQDAALLAEALRAHCGFECQTLLGEQATREAIRAAVKSAGTGSLFLFFFAGHGESVEGAYYLHPWDGEAESGFDSIPFTELARHWAGARFGYERCVALLDACRSSLGGGGRRGPVGLQSEDTRDAVAAQERSDRDLRILYGCAYGQCCLEFDELSHGLLSYHLAEVIRERGEAGLTLNDLVEEASDRMRAWQKEKRGQVAQSPQWLGTPTKARIVLVEGQADTAAQPTKAKVVCPACGIRNDPDETFRCLVCGRDHLCLAHYVKDRGRCGDCVAEEKQKAEEEAAARRAEEQRKAREAATRAEAKRKAEEGARRADRECRRLVEDAWAARDRARRTSRHQDWEHALRLASEAVALLRGVETGPSHVPAVPGGPVVLAREARALLDEATREDAKHRRRFRVTLTGLAVAAVLCPVLILGTISVTHQVAKAARERQAAEETARATAKAEQDRAAAEAASKAARDREAAQTATRMEIVRRLPKVIASRPPWASVSDAQMEEAARLGVSVAREISLSEGVSLRFVLVPTGEFMMGSPESEKGRTTSEGPVHRVPITQAFFLGICEVSQEQYQAVMGKNPSRSQGAKKPVENVSWDDAWEFCKKLSEKQGEPVRLPTEAEWEYACRAGTTTPFNFGEWIWTDKANYDGDAYGDGRRGKWVGETVPVGSFPPNAWGLYDMHGNVREWCQSLYIPYPYRFDDGREEVRSARPRAVRGGAWSDSPKECRSAGRGPWRPRDPDEHDAYTGFRVLLEPQSPVP